MHRFWDNVMLKLAIVTLVLVTTFAIMLSVVMGRVIQREVRQQAIQTAREDVAVRVLRRLTPEDFQQPMTGYRYQVFDRYVDDNISSPRIAQIKVWNPQGVVIYSTNPGEVGRTFDIEEELATALRGETAGEIVAPRGPQHTEEAGLGKVLEVYVPAFFPEPAGVVGSIEVYEPYAPFAATIATIQRTAYAIIAAGAAIGYAIIVRLVWSNFQMVGAQRDAFLRQNAELERRVALRTAELQAIQESITDGLIVADGNGRIRYINRSMEALWEAPKAYILHDRIDAYLDLKAGHVEPPESLQLVKDMVRIEPPETRSVELALKGSRPRDLLFTAFPIPVAGSVRLVGLLARDVTEEREAQRRRDTFVSIASHELRTPLTVVMGFAELLVMGGLPEPRRSWADQIFQESKRLAYIVDDLLNVSRIQSGKLKLELAPLALPEVVESAVERVSPSTSRHEFLIQVPADTPPVIADQDKLGQVLINLLSNAIKYSPHGGRITVSARPDLEHRWVVIAVQDEGLGIAPEDQQRLFTTFQRIRRPETEGIRGTGLGLYIVKEMVELMHGQVWLESELNKGSTFYVALPIIQTNGAGAVDIGHHMGSPLAIAGSPPVQLGSGTL